MEDAKRLAERALGSSTLPKRRRWRFAWSTDDSSKVVPPRRSGGRERESVGKIVHDAHDPLLDETRTEVDEQAKAPVGKTDVGENRWR